MKRHTFSIVRWTLAIVLAAVFLYEGLDKFGERRLCPCLTLAGIALLSTIMMGALAVHLFVIGVGPQTIVVVVLMGLLGALAWCHKG